MGRKNYTFAALVGQDDLKTVLILNAIYPSIGGVLIRGEKGTAKSTAARGLADLLPSIRVIAGDPYNRDPDNPAGYPGDIQADAGIADITAPFVDLPIGATEDRVLGSLDFEAALRDGKRVFHPGLLAAANRGILYIDEVNLLPAHLVDVLLDAAAMGINTVQREGITLTHPAQFMLVGTMNPEEGDLRPQLLDRFGLMVDVTAPRDTALRSEVVRRRIAFESNTDHFIKMWELEQEALRQQILEAKSRLENVELHDDLLDLISRICTEFEVDGLRADITLHKTARALAAWEGHLSVTPEDIRRAAEWVLPHRRRRQPFEPPALDKDKLDELMNTPPNAANRPSDGEDEPGDNSASDDDSHVFTASKPQQIKRLQVAGRNSQVGMGRRNPVSGKEQGHYIRAVMTRQPDDIALDATLRSVALNGTTGEGKPIILSENLRYKVRSSTTDTLILFVVDASGSMAARQRMEAVKGAVLALLTDAYQQRDRVAVIAFKGIEAELILPPTRSVELAEKQLDRLPTGGRTPLAHALIIAHETVQQALRANAEQLILMIILSDGKANVPLPDSTGDAWEQTQQAAHQLTERSLPTLMLDTETSYVRMGRGRELAEHLHAEYLELDNLSANSLMLTIRQHLR
ncbi:MAG: magnesium chelatase subunit D family protein [Blastochloris sp.]|nr:magnesium chelatase subunit D family protein [Blastochloris sp.]